MSTVTFILLSDEKRLSYNANSSLSALKSSDIFIGVYATFTVLFVLSSLMLPVFTPSLPFSPAFPLLFPASPLLQAVKHSSIITKKIQPNLFLMFPINLLLLPLHFILSLYQYSNTTRFPCSWLLPQPYYLHLQCLTLVHVHFL